MPAWCRTKLLSGLCDEPVSQHLQQEVAGFGSAAQLHAARTDKIGIPAQEAWLGEALDVALHHVAKRKDDAVAVPRIGGRTG